MGAIRRKARRAALVTMLWLAHPGTATACSVCMSGREDENQLAFILTTVFLTVLPLGLIGSVILHLCVKILGFYRIVLECWYSLY